ncbi:universal stress protein [Hymenobacter volaticus]|uniref:Universal stress protein n=1 Tax=Hymenobacter volaticus TaxID=2932254 RepID=A0ABY4G9P9_9BACT|nr:universal stress protein [Hymenobacter volaticus]UOQ67548.1 universal stress protein [Hymenobacter volaticus]
MPTSILVLTDFTDASDQALTYADALAVPLGASLVLLHIRREPLLDTEAFNGHIQYMSEGEIAAALANRSAPLASSVVVETVVESVAVAVQQAAAKYHPLLVVLGKPDTATSSDELVASIPRALLRATLVPLLLVPVGATVSVPPTQVTLAADGHPFHLHTEVLNAARQLLTALAPTFTVTYVAKPENSDNCAPSLAAVQGSGLGAAVPTIQTHGVRNRHEAEGILQAAAETGADLLVVVARRRSFLSQLFHRSISTQVILQTSVPILLMSAKD